MNKTHFEEFVKSNEKDLRRIRNTYFPFIKERMITGYNIHMKEYPFENAEFILSYLHANLKPNDRHLRELSDILSRECSLEKIVFTNGRVINRSEILQREADYLTVPNWDDPQDMRYFTLEGDELSRDDAKKLEVVIGESLQYNLLIRLSNEIDLRNIVNVFKKYAPKYNLDRKGNSTKFKNKDAIFDAWYVPMLFFSTKVKKPKDFIDFLTVKQFNIAEIIGEKPVNFSTLVRKKAKYLKENLQTLDIPFKVNKRYVLRLAVSNYIDA